MYIYLHDGSGDNATEIQSSVTWNYALALRLENLPEMYPASSEPSYDGHGELNQHCVPACHVFVIKVAAVSSRVSSTTSCQHQATKMGTCGGRGIASTYAATVRKHVGTQPS